MSVPLVLIEDSAKGLWHVAFGLEWHALSGGGSEKKEHSDLVGQSNAAYEVRYANDQAIMYGFLPDGDVQEDLPKAARSRMLSASALLASFPDIASNAIWIEVDGPSARMAVLRGGLPLPSGDFLGDLGEANDRIRQIEEDSGLSFSFYGNYQSVYASSIPITLAELVEEGDRSAAALKRASKGTSVGQWALLLALIGIVAYVFWPASAPKPMKAKQAEDPNVAYLRSLPGKLSAAGVPVSVAAPILVGNWSLDTLQGGWELTEIRCTVAECRYTWSIKGGNYKSLIDALAGIVTARDMQFSTDGKTASYAIPNRQVQQGGFEQSKLPALRAFEENFGSLSQDVSLLSTVLTRNPPTVFGAEQGAAVAALREPVKSGQISGKGPLCLLKEVLAKLPGAINIDELSIKTNGIDPQFTFQGTYYVKN